ncbi:hypothetical protein [Psychrosphaera haliotis]|uniref:Uncharacterized protein n=1 Tax=Psychrosphaera haliotis TaxID=555083 RepID=A0A6N8F8H4_9GAMM|nr:hypothetical protein [Psychrosphaera haliotis]MUH72713.1 hypothetical protein [Psychrosphaera haliotis]
MIDQVATKKKVLSRKSTEVVAYIQQVEKAKRDAEVLTLREWFDTTPKHQQEVIDYMEKYKQLGRLGKELHNRGVARVTERFGDDVRTLVEATYQRGLLDIVAPLAALACVTKKS